MVYHAPKPSQVRCGNHAPRQFKERDLDVEQRDSKNRRDYMKMTFTLLLSLINSAAFILTE